MPKVKFYGEFGNATEDHIAIIKLAGTIIDEVLKSPQGWDAFAKAVRDADFSGGTLWRSADKKVVSKNKDEILEFIRKGSERENPAEDGEIDIRIELRPHPKGTVGTTKLGENPIKPALWFANRCVAKRDAISMARHLMHEWMHVAGFFHASSGANQDDVPYEIGDIIRKLARENRGRPGFEPQYEDEDSLNAQMLDEAEDSVDWGDETVVTKTTIAVPN